MNRNETEDTIEGQLVQYDLKHDDDDIFHSVATLAYVVVRKCIKTCVADKT